jgi:lipid-A-disaccharide synthase-like uncharacterized protein
MSITAEQIWLAVGFVAQALFGARFLVQWITSERRKESVVPIAFWYLSLSGSAMLLTYAIYRQDPVFILGQSTGSIIYIRNLILIHRKRRDEALEAAAAVADPEHGEEPPAP